MRTFVLSPFDGRSWRAALSIGFGLFSTIIAASIVATLFSTGGSLLLLMIGFPIVALGIEAARLFARVERWRMTVIDDHPLIAHPYRTAVLAPSEPYGPWIRQLAEAAFFDMSRWLDVVYVLIAVPLAAIQFVVAVMLWTTSVGLMLTPLALLIPRQWVSFRIGALELDPVVAVASTFLLGLLLLPVAASVTRGMAILHRYVVEGLLCISPTEALRRDNERLRDSRSAAIELEASELRRIERDLHDGAQQRLVMLAIDLSLAEDKIDTDPAAAKRLVAGARDQARQALGELRDVVRGAAPAILVDRGLVAALSAVAGRSPIPTYVDSSLAQGERLPPGVERAAYYVVSEALTNVAKHGRATRCDIRLIRQPGWLFVEIRDDGAGGAAIVPGGGLAGLRDRVEALDGRLELISPLGGPTIIRVSLPAAAV
ncbi:MAG TPA: sensor histidine kinase [Candidatus Limnocylindrales bacterium]|nr:sensor histidine kinase [Candidatus Limnocylindrales bacterium]